MRKQNIDILELFKQLKYKLITVAEAKAILANEKKSIDTLSNEGKSLLHYAAESAQVELVTDLLEADAYVNLETATGDHTAKANRALKLVLNKLHEINLNSCDPDHKEEITKLEIIKYLLLDYGSNRKDLGEHNDEQKLINDISRYLGINKETIQINKQKITNTLIVKNCAAGNKDLEIIYENFYSFLQSKLTSIITGLYGASSNLLTFKKDQEGEFIKSLISKIPLPEDLKQTSQDFSLHLKTVTKDIAFIVYPLSSIILNQVSEVILSSFKEKQINNFKMQASHFKNYAHADYIVESYAARMVEYYRHDILRENPDIGVIDSFKNNLTGVKGTISSGIEYLSYAVLSHLTAVSTNELIARHKKDGDKILESHWKVIATKCVANFLGFLLNHNVDYQVNLGIKAAESLIPKWIAEKFTLDIKNKAFSESNAYNLAVITHLLYESKEQILYLGEKWGFEKKNIHVKYSDYFQSAIIADKEKIIIAFRGTFHEINWLSNVDALVTGLIKVDGKKINVHGGFYKALLAHWEKDTLGEESLKTVLINRYLKSQDYSNAKIFITGHSLGGAMASISYLKFLELISEQNNGKQDVLKSYINKTTLYTYGQLRWCTKNSEEDAKSLFDLNYYRLVNYLDLVPKVPPECLAYVHLGEGHYLHKDGSLLDETKLSQFFDEKDSSGNLKIASGVRGGLASALFIDNHYMDKYIKKLALLNASVQINADQNKAEVITHNNTYSTIGNSTTTSDNLSIANNSNKASQENILSICISKEAKKLSAKGTDINYRSDQQLTLLHIAAAEGDIETVESLLGKKVAVNTIDKIGRTPLYLAIINHHIKIAEILIEKGADTNFTVWSKKQPLLCWAAEHGYVNLLDLLLTTSNRTIDVNIRDQDNNSPLYLATKKGFLKSVEILLTKDASVNDKYKYWATPLQKAAENGYSEIVQLLLNAGAKIDEKDEFGYNSLLLALRNGHLQVAELLIRNGAEYNPEILSKMDDEENSLLHLCCVYEGLEDLYLYIVNRFQAQITRKNKLGKDIEELALEFDRFVILEKIWQNRKNEKSLYNENNEHKLVKESDKKTKELSKIYKFVGWDITIKEARKGIDINKVNEKGNTLLYELVAKECINNKDIGEKVKYIEKVLENNNINVNHTERSNGWTPLHLAVSSDQGQIVELLVKNKADIWQVDKYNKTPLDLAIINRYENIIKNESIIDHIVDLSHQSSNVLNSFEGSIKLYIQKILLLNSIYEEANLRNMEGTKKYLVKWERDLKARFKKEYPKDLEKLNKDQLEGKVGTFDLKLLTTSFDSSSAVNEDEGYASDYSTSSSGISDYTVEAMGTSHTP